MPISVIDSYMYMYAHLEHSMTRHSPLSQELARCEVLERADKLKHHQQVYKQQRAHKAKLSYKKDSAMCRDMLLLMVDMASKLAQYRELTKGSVSVGQTAQQIVFAQLISHWNT